MNRRIDDPETIAWAVTRRKDRPDLDGPALLELALQELQARDRSMITEAALEAHLVAEARIAHALTNLTITNIMREPGVSGNYVQVEITFDAKANIVGYTARLITLDEQAAGVLDEAEAITRAAAAE